VPVSLLAYPNGTPADYDARTVEAARQAGYTYALTARAGWNSRSTEAFELRRVVLEPHGQLSQIVLRRVAVRVVRTGRAGARAALPSRDGNHETS
jgi:hypothetical protein